MNIAICDDEKYWQDTLRDMVCRWGEAGGVKALCAVYASTREFMQDMLAKRRFDLILLDIEFEHKVEGIEISKNLRAIGCKVPLVFVSGHAMLASRGYYVEALGFLVKPVRYEELDFFLDKAKKIRGSGRGRLLRVVTATSETHLPVSEISYVESSGHDLIIHADSGEYKVRQTMNEMMERLGGDAFIRVHKAYIVALDRMMSIKTKYPYVIDLDAGNGTHAEIPVGRAYFTEAQGRYASSIREVIV